MGYTRSGVSVLISTQLMCVCVCAFVRIRLFMCDASIYKAREKGTPPRSNRVRRIHFDHIALRLSVCVCGFLFSCILSNILTNISLSLSTTKTYLTCFIYTHKAHIRFALFVRCLYKDTNVKIFFRYYIQWRKLCGSYRRSDQNFVSIFISFFFVLMPHI